MFRDNPTARTILYWTAFVAAALALFAVLIPGIGPGLAAAFTGLAALAQSMSSATALANMPAKVVNSTATEDADYDDEPSPAESQIARASISGPEPTLLR